MRFLTKVKDGGPSSNVDALVLVEIKGLFSIMLLKFNKGQREAYHSHAFHALSWFLKGKLVEHNYEQPSVKYKRSLFPKITPRNQVHRVEALEDSWVFTLRGPWVKRWVEVDPVTKVRTTFQSPGRQVVSTTPT